MATTKRKSPMKKKASTRKSTATQKPATRRASSNGAKAPKRQPVGDERQKPGATGKGEYYHVEVLPRAQFKAFRTQDVGRKGGLQRVAGQRADGSWDTQTWLIAKNMAHVDEGGRLVPDSPDAKEVLGDLNGEATRTRGDRFKLRQTGRG